MPSFLPRSDAGGPRQLFASTPADRTALARTQFFEEGVRPSGLVDEAVIQSWMRCSRTHSDRGRAVTFDEVSPSRLHATLGRSRQLLEAARDELTQLESSLAGTGCRVLLTDGLGVIVHATHQPMAAQQPILRHTARLGVNLGEQAVGTTAPGIVAASGRACTVSGGEHYFDCLRSMECAAAPIRDVRGQVAAVLDLSVESRRFGFDAASIVALHATTIENRFLVSQSPHCLVLRFQASAALLGTPLEALAGVTSDGEVAWLNDAAARLVGRPPADAAHQAHDLFGLRVDELMRFGRRAAAQQLRLPNGLCVWLQAMLRVKDGVDFKHAVAVSIETNSTQAREDVDDANEASHAQPSEVRADGTLRAHSRQLIEATLAAYGGNISQAARQLRVSRGTLYRRIKDWQPS